MKQHEEMIRLINETPMRYLQENEAAMARLREFTDGLATSRLLQAIDSSAIAKITTALDVDTPGTTCSTSRFAASRGSRLQSQD